MVVVCVRAALQSTIVSSGFDITIAVSKSKAAFNHLKINLQKFHQIKGKQLMSQVEINYRFVDIETLNSRVSVMKKLVFDIEILQPFIHS